MTHAITTSCMFFISFLCAVRSFTKDDSEIAIVAGLFALAACVLLK